LTPHVIDTQKIPSMLFSGIQGIGENFNGIQGINSYRKAKKWNELQAFFAKAQENYASLY